MARHVRIVLPTQVRFGGFLSGWGIRRIDWRRIHDVYDHVRAGLRKPGQSSGVGRPPVHHQ